MFTAHFLSFLMHFGALEPLKSPSEVSNGRYLKRLLTIGPRQQEIEFSAGFEYTDRPASPRKPAESLWGPYAVARLDLVRVSFRN